MNKDFVKKLITIQSELKCNKSQRNAFAEFNYRSCEDIFKSLKPFLLKHDLLLYISDTIESLNGFTYIKATVTLTDGENAISSNGWAKEPELKKKLDSSQVTGSCSSYARKYAIGGLLMIDDSQDPDSMDNSSTPTTSKKPSLPKRPSPIRKNDTALNPTEDQKVSAYIARIHSLTEGMLPSEKENAIKKASYDSEKGWVDDVKFMKKNGVKLNSDQLLVLGQKLAEDIKKEEAKSKEKATRELSKDAYKMMEV